MFTDHSKIESGIPEAARAVILGVLLMAMLDGLFVIVASEIMSPDSFVVDIANFTIDFIVILFLNSKYPIRLFHIEEPRKVLISGLSWSLLPLTIFIYQIASQHFTIPPDFARFQTFTNFEKGVFFIFNTILPAFFEETLFRGYFYRILRNRYDIFWGLSISTFLFVAAHGFQIPIIFQSLLYTYVYEKTGSVWGSSLTHFMNNLIWFLIAYSLF